MTIFAFSLTDTFDTIGTFIGTGRKSGIFDEADEKALQEGKGFKSKMDKALFADSTTIYDYLVQRDDVNAAKIVAISGSLGTGIATYLASQRDLLGIVLFSPSDQIAGGVAQDILPFLPTKFLFKNKFAILPFATLIDTPVLAIIGEDDRVIFPKRSLKILNNFKSETRIEIITGDHYSIYEEPYSWEVINQFLSSLED